MLGNQGGLGGDVCGLLLLFVLGRMWGVMGEGPPFPLSVLWGIDTPLLTIVCRAKASVTLTMLGEHFGAVALLAS